MEHAIKRQMIADADLTPAEITALLVEDINRHGCNTYIRRTARKRRLAIEFGAQRGWTLSKPFGRAALIRGGVHSYSGGLNAWLQDELPHEFFDHPYFYRANRRAVAIAAHLYGFNPKKIEKFCHISNLQWETPDFPSWWNPGQTTLVVFTKGTTGTTRGHFA